MKGRNIALSGVLALITLSIACIPLDSDLPGSDPELDEYAGTGGIGRGPDEVVEVGDAPPPLPGDSGFDEAGPVFCGNGFIEPGETCDDGRGNGEDKPCTPDCQDAACGDGYVYEADGEECDNGVDNADDAEGYGSCSASCELLEGCGDTVVQPGHEECDDGFEGSAKCTSSCELIGAIVFVTETSYTGAEIGGLDGADLLCQIAAVQGGLQNPGSYKAWLSTKSEAAKDRLEHLDMAYVRVDRTVVAVDWVDLTDGTLQNPIQVTELNNNVGNKSVWTNTTLEGKSVPDGDDCDSWTSNTGGSQFGYSGAKLSPWTAADGVVFCSSKHRLYCIEQPGNG